MIILKRIPDTTDQYAYPEPRLCTDVTREIAPHFTASFSDVFFSDVNVQILPETQQTTARCLRSVVLLQGFDKVQDFLLFVRRQIAEFFENLLFDRHETHLSPNS